MNRFKEIEQFLKYFAKVYEQNPSVNISKDTIYYYLTEYGVPIEEKRDSNVLDYFEKWIVRFSGAKNLRVYQSERQKSFLQFHSRNGRQDNKYVKLYLNCSKHSIYNSVNDIFDFINRENIDCYSKVANVLRSDGVVLRIGTVEEALKVMDYIHHNPNIFNETRVTNPFLYRSGVVGIAYDDNFSYNSIVASIICDYYKTCRNKNILNSVSFEHFKNYVLKSYDYYFKSNDGIQELLETDLMKNWYYRVETNEDAIVNMEQVYKMLLLSLDEKVNEKDILNYIRNCQNHKYCQDMCNYYKAVVHPHSVIPQKLNKTVNLGEIKEFIDQYILYICETKGFGFCKVIFEHYCNGEYNYITRTNNFRTLFKEKIGPNDIYSVIGDDVDLYERELYHKAKMKQNSESHLSNQVNKKELLDQYIQHNINKYGEKMTCLQLQSYLTGNFNVITRDYNFRELFRQYITGNDIVSITGNSIEEYVRLFVQKKEHFDLGKAMKVLDQYIRQMFLKNVSVTEIENNLKMYASGNIEAITVDGNFRLLFSTYIPCQILPGLMDNDIRNYVQAMQQFYLDSKDIIK